MSQMITGFQNNIASQIEHPVSPYIAQKLEQLPINIAQDQDRENAREQEAQRAYDAKLDMLIKKYEPLIRERFEKQSRLHRHMCMSFDFDDLKIRSYELPRDRKDKGKARDILNHMLEKLTSSGDFVGLGFYVYHNYSLTVRFTW